MVKQIKYNRSIKQFKLILDTFEINRTGGNSYYYNANYIPNDEILYYTKRNGKTLYINYQYFIEREYTYELDVDTIADLIHESFIQKPNTIVVRNSLI